MELYVEYIIKKKQGLCVERWGIELCFECAKKKKKKEISREKADNLVKVENF